MASPQEYEHMDEEELAQLQEAYRKLGQPLPPGLQDELELRPLLKSLETLDGSPGQEIARASSAAALSNSPGPNQKQPGHLSASSMNRRQWACVLAAFLLLVLSLLFPPTKMHSAAVRGLYGPSDSVSYAFIFTMHGTVEFTRLFVEWLLTVLVTGGLFVAFRKSEESQSKPSTWTTPKDDRLAAPLGPDQERFENARPDHGGRAWTRKLAIPRKFIVPLIVAFAVCALGLAYYGSRRITRNLPTTENSKLAGGASITNYGKFEWNAYNGSDFVLTEVRVSISVFDEKRNALISNRVYRVPAYDFYPQQTKELSTDVGFTLGPDQKWGWIIVEAKGRPE
jgi:hypothetical protein